MSLENNLYQIDFCNRRKRSVISPRYLSVEVNWFGSGNSFVGGGSSIKFVPIDELLPKPTPLKYTPPKLDLDFLKLPILEEKEKNIPATVVDFPASGFQFHYHEDENGIIENGKLKPYGPENKDNEIELDNYKISTGALYAALLGWKEMKSD